MRFASHVRFVLLGVGALLLLWGTGAPFAAGQSRAGLTRGPGLGVDGSRYNQNVLYRPSSAEYRVWEGGRFDVIYQEGTRSTARHMKGALQSAWPKVDSLAGPVSSGLEPPVILNGYSDQGGGRVRLFPYYQEITAQAPRFPQLAARPSTWATAVAPHELVHSAQLDVDAGFGLGEGAVVCTGLGPRLQWALSPWCGGRRGRLPRKPA